MIARHATAPEQPLAQKVFAELSGADFRSGEALAEQLDVTRAAVWKAVERLRELGVPLEAQASRGYRLADGVNALTRAGIEADLPRATRAALDEFEIHWSLGSTNDRALELGPPPAHRARVVLTEQQTAGRGRRGRAWIAPPGGAVCLSIGWSFAEMPADLPALALVIGVCAQRALSLVGAHDVRLKWPNDLVTSRGKLGGILLELRAEAGGPAFVVVGIGINVVLSASDRAAIAAAGANAVALKSLTPAPVTRDHVVSALLRECIDGLERFSRTGFAPFHNQFVALDALRGIDLNVQSGEGVVAGVGRGIDAHGQLLVETRQGVRAFASGEVSVRAVRHG